MPRILLVTLFLISSSIAFSQSMSPETRARFIKDQDQYLESLKLNLDQRRTYQTITIKYEKQSSLALRSVKGAGSAKSKLKSIRKAKDTEMKRVLSKYQFKQYLKRQKEIDKNYE